MPIYKYICNVCQETSTFMHASEDIRTDCKKCEEKNTLSKLLAKPLISKNINKNEQDSTIGEVTKEFIEKNREILKQQKKEYSNKHYDKS